MTVKRWYFPVLPLIVSLLLVNGCVAASVQVIPTARPSLTPTITAQAIGSAATPTATPTTVRSTPTGGPSPTPLFGPTQISLNVPITPTRVLNPNAPRIEYFAADTANIAPGGEVTLFWSTRNVEQAVIYRLDENGQRTLAYNIGPDGRQTVSVGANERGNLDFVLIVGEGAQQVQQQVSLPITCPIIWFFAPAPEACPSAEAQPSPLVEQAFERGRMIYISENNRIYALFNDGREPAWVDFASLYDPEIHPERDESFEISLAGTGLVQPVGKLGFVWRGNDTVRTRLGVGSSPETTYDGFVQRAPTRDGTSNSENLYLTSSTGTVIQLLPGGTAWQIITPG